MPFVRPRGQQISILHGFRNKKTGQVDQQVLFTFHSKPEAREAIGQGSPGGAKTFQFLLEKQFPRIKFDWRSINGAVAAHLDVLPDEYAYEQERLLSRFRSDLWAFSRQVFLADPQGDPAAVGLLKSVRSELDFLLENIRCQLESVDRKDPSLGAEIPFYWRWAMPGRDVPYDVEEMAVGYFERGQWERAAGAFRLLVECYPDYADGHNFLGLIELERENLDGAMAFFEKTVEVGRRLLPRRVRPSDWWSDLDTRPYMRGLRNKVTTLTRLGRLEEALSVVEMLESECHDDITAIVHRAAICLDQGRWEEAVEMARRVRLIWPSESFIAGFALAEIGRIEEARVDLLHATLNAPLSAHLLAGTRRVRPSSYLEAEDYNEGVDMLKSLGPFLNRKRSASRAVLRDLLGNPRVQALLTEAQEVTSRWRNERGSDRSVYDRMTELHSLPFASAAVPEIWS